MKRTGHQGSAEWHAERRTGYGASDAPILVEGNEADWRQLHGEKLGLLPDRTASETMELGLVLEDAILREGAAREGWKVQRVNRIVRHPDLPHVFASLDARKRGDRRPVEVKKWAVKGDDWGPAGSDTVPTRILYQVQQQAAVTGADAVEVLTLFGGAKLERFTVGRDGTIIDELLGLETAAWQFIQRGEMPPWPGPTPKRIVLAHDEVEVDDLMRELVRIHELEAAEVAEAKAGLDNIKDRLRDILADAGAAKGVTEDGRRLTITHRPQEPRQTVAWELVAKAYRQMLETSERDALIPRTPEELGAIESMFTTTAAPIRPLRVTVGKPTP